MADALEKIKEAAAVKPRKKTFVAIVALILLLLGWATLSGGGRIYIGYSGRWTGFSLGHYYMPDAFGENSLKWRFVIFGPVRVDHFEPETRIIEPPTEASVVGAYLHTNRLLNDKIVLEPGGRFYQEVTYTDGRVWTITNSWSLTDLTLRLDECYEPYDWEKKVVRLRPERVTITALWENKGFRCFNGPMISKTFRRSN